MMARIKVASWNVNSIIARLPRVLEFLSTVQPDVVGIQELKTETSRFPLAEINALGYHAAVHGQKTYNGVAILSRKPLADIDHCFDDGTEQLPARYISATMGDVVVICVYVPNGQEVGSDKYRYKLDWMTRFAQHLKLRYRPDSRLIVMGDFNVAPENRDVHDPARWEGKVLFSEPERKGLSAIMDFGLIDTFRLHHPEGGFYSWWDYRQLSFVKNHGLRIDFILSTKSLSACCRQAEILREFRKGTKPSDHVPVIAEFEL